MLLSLRSKIYQFLRRSERIIQTDLVYLVKQGSWLFFSNIGISLIGLATSYLYANFLSKEQYGQYRYIFSLFSALNALSLTGINVAVTQAVAKGKEGALLQSIPLQFKWNTLFCLAFVGIGSYYLWQGNMSLALSLFTLSCLGPLANIANTYGAFLQGKKAFRVYSVIGLLTSLAILGSVALVLWLRSSVVVLVIANIGTTALVQVLALLWTIQHYKPNSVRDEGLASFSKRISLVTAISTVVTQLDTVIVFHFLGAASVSILSFATVIPDQLKSFVKILGQLALPKFAVNESRASRRQAAMNTAKLAAGVFAVSLLYILAAPVLFKIVFPAYQGAVWYTRIYALSMVFSVYQIPISLMFAHKHEKEITRFSLFSSFISLTGSCFLIPFYGLIGSLIGRMVAQCMNLAISSYYVWLKPQTQEHSQKAR